LHSWMRARVFTDPFHTQIEPRPNTRNDDGTGLSPGAATPEASGRTRASVCGPERPFAGRVAGRAAYCWNACTHMSTDPSESTPRT
jgi:hypothetical protein